MKLYWLQPAAWWGVIAVAVPVLIHLLVRHESRRLLFPSLRFLRTTAVASWRRQVISDWPLLMVRALILAAAVAALAAPVFISDVRRQQWGQRVARAIVVVQPAANAEAGTRTTDDDAIRRERESSAFSAAFAARAQVADAVRDAVAWLQRQPPAKRELVIAGDLRRGAVTAGDLAVVPAAVGIRFAPTASAPTPAATSMAAVADNGDGATAGFELNVTPTDRSTEVAYRPMATPAEWLSVQAPAYEQRYADALRAATMAEGLVNDRPRERRVLVVFPGEGMPRAADVVKPAASSWMHDAAGRLDGLAAGERQGQWVVLADVPVTDPAAVDLVARVARIALTTSRVELEPLPMAPERLAAWSRPPGSGDWQAPPRDEGDRRWLWAAALALLAVEELLRRARRAPSSSTTGSDREARVA